MGLAGCRRALEHAILTSPPWIFSVSADGLCTAAGRRDLYEPCKEIKKCLVGDSLIRRHALLCRNESVNVVCLCCSVNPALCRSEIASATTHHGFLPAGGVKNVFRILARLLGGRAVWCGICERPSDPQVHAGLIAHQRICFFSRLEDDRSP